MHIGNGGYYLGDPDDKDYTPYISYDERYKTEPKVTHNDVTKLTNEQLEEIFGIKIKKENNKFKLLSSLYSMKFSLDDLRAISLLTSSIHNFPDLDLTQDVSNFIQSLEARMNNDDKNKLDALNQNLTTDNSFYYSDFREQIKQCEEICIENHEITVTYKKRKKEITRKCAPKEIIYDSKNAYLKVYDAVMHQHYEIPITNILSITKSPRLASSIEMKTTVVYKLKNRLAKTYKLKDDEQSEGFDKDGNQIIVNKGGVMDTLIPRLLRYSYNCEVISPKYLREEMKRIINETISQYEE